MRHCPFRRSQGLGLQDGRPLLSGEEQARGRRRSHLLEQLHPLWLPVKQSDVDALPLFATHRPILHRRELLRGGRVHGRGILLTGFRQQAPPDSSGRRPHPASLWGKDFQRRTPGCRHPHFDRNSRDQDTCQDRFQVRQEIQGLPGMLHHRYRRTAPQGPHAPSP